MIINVNNIYDIGDIVYSKLYDGSSFVIIDIIYCVRLKELLYECANSDGNVFRLIELQLTNVKPVM